MIGALSEGEKNMKYRILSLILVLFLSAPAPIFSQTIQWKEFSANNGDVIILMPGTPKYSTSTTKSPVGKVVNHTYMVIIEGDTFTINYSKLPWEAIRFGGDHTIYENAKGDLLKEVFGKPISFTDISHGKLSGKELVYHTPPHQEHPGFSGKAQMYLVGKEFYLVNITVAKGKPALSIERFFNSLKLKSKK